MQLNLRIHLVIAPYFQKIHIHPMPEMIQQQERLVLFTREFTLHLKLLPTLKLLQREPWYLQQASISTSNMP